jgi:hypothetical protein
VPEATEELEARLREALEPGFAGRLRDRGLARGLIWQDGELPPGAPTFADALTEDLLDHGHAVLAMSLRLRASSGDSEVLPRAFLAAGEVLEAAVHRGDEGRWGQAGNRVTAAVAFHLARYSARSFSVAPPGHADLSPSEKALVLLMRRQLDDLRGHYASWLLDPSRGDDAIAASLADDDEYDASDAISDVFTGTMMRGVALFDHALATGSGESTDQARDVLRRGAAAASDLHSVPHWWALTLASHLIDDLWQHSLHELLPTLPPGTPTASWNGLRWRFLHRLRRKGHANIELWPSQIQAAARAIDPTDSLVAALPTGAGKTRIAEMCILRALSDPERRVVYVTPLRALSAQVERDLSGTFGPLGFRVSRLYGAAGSLAGDEDTLRSARIVVSTPEKLDFALRSDSTIIDNVALVVLDEAHMLGAGERERNKREAGEREVRYEALIQRLLLRHDASARRIVCLSALFPDEPNEMQDLVDWIRRDEPGASVRSDWRPTGQRYGWLRWHGQGARMEIESQREPAFIPTFVESSPPPDGSRRKNRFPHTKQELTFAAAWKFLDRGRDVLVFCPERRSVEAYGKCVAQSVQQGCLPARGVDADAIREAIAVGTEWLGEDHPAVACLLHGVALHHGLLPRPFLHRIETLVRDRVCRLTIASPTVAQGLNLPAGVVLVPSLWRNRQQISPDELSNVAGRAGRAFVDMDGLVIHVVHEGDDQKNQQRIDEWRRLVGSIRRGRIESALLVLTQSMCEALGHAQGIAPHQVLAYVAGNAEAWDYSYGMEASGRVDNLRWTRDVASLDAAILSMLEMEAEADDLLEALNAALSGSLFARQLPGVGERWRPFVQRFLYARAQYLWAETTVRQRHAYYTAGVGLATGQFLDANADDLVSALLSLELAIAGENSEAATRRAREFAELAFQTYPFTPRQQPDDWRDGLTRWLSGEKAADVRQALGKHGGEFLRDTVQYRLVWAMEAVRVYARSSAHARADEIAGVGAMAVEAGTLSLPTMLLMRAGLESRELTQYVVHSTECAFTDYAGMRAWLRSAVARELSADHEWPESAWQSAWERFTQRDVRGADRTWSRDEQALEVRWSASSDRPEAGVWVVLNAASNGDDVMVLTPEFSPLGRLRRALEHPIETFVHARVGANRDRIVACFFGPLSLGY